MIHDYLEAGFRVFPLWPIENGQCSCSTEGCDQPGKHPRIRRWQQVPDWSDEQIEVMVEHQQAEDHFGVLCAGRLVVDIDPRNGGDDSYWRLVEDLGGPDIAMQSGFVVQTGGGGRHIYFDLPDDGAAYLQHLDAYPGIDFKTSGYVVGAGSLHASGTRYSAGHGSPHDIEQAPDDLLALLRRPDVHRTQYKGAPLDVTEQDIGKMLSHIDNRGEGMHYEDWIRVGMAIHHATGGSGYALWDHWSTQSDKYDPEQMEKKWHSFGKAAMPVTIGTLMHYAQEGGYRRPIVFEHDQGGDDDASAPFPTGHVDLLRPPGLVGDLTQWINSQCRYPRERLAVAAALTAMGNVAGLRYTDDKDRVTLNLLTLCVSGSATGKEAVLQAATAIHEAVSLQPAVVGNIKSEQEIVRNLVRHQAAFYLIDEIGYLLQKIESARQKGGAAYLDGVIAILMAVYSKADGAFLVSGDIKNEVRNTLLAEVKQCDAKIKENEDPDGRFLRRKQQIETHAIPEIDMGIQRPFLSMMGMTTPVSFDGIVTVEQATNGFVGRCLLVREPETNPRRKRRFKRPPRDLPEKLKLQLCALYDGGTYSVKDTGRIEYHGERREVPTDADAVDMLEEVADWLEDYAEAHKGRTGLEAIVRRTYEQVAKVSTILALGEGLRTAQHVEWAFAFCRADLEAKISLAHANMTEGTDDALRLRVMEAIGDGEKHGTIRNRVSRSKKYSAQDVDRMLDHLVECGDVSVEERQHGRTKRTYTVYRISG
jgi:hypothetical protein